MLRVVVGEDEEDVGRGRECRMQNGECREESEGEFHGLRRGV